jgi:hypothetical protein
LLTVNRRWWRVHDHAATVHNQHAIRACEHAMNVMANHDHGCSRQRFLANRRHQMVPTLKVECRIRFVKQEHRCALGTHTSHVHALSFSTGKLSD